MHFDLIQTRIKLNVLFLHKLKLSDLFLMFSYEYLKFFSFLSPHFWCNNLKTSSLLGSYSELFKALMQSNSQHKHLSLMKFNRAKNKRWKLLKLQNRSPLTSPTPPVRSLRPAYLSSPSVSSSSSWSGAASGSSTRPQSEKHRAAEPWGRLFPSARLQALMCPNTKPWHWASG